MKHFTHILLLTLILFAPLSAQTDSERETGTSPNKKYTSFVRGNNLFVVETATKKETQLTKDGDANHLNGVLDWVYEEELYGRGNKRGYVWSPDSSAIAFLALDETRVPRFTITNQIPADANQINRQQIENQAYPKAGDPNPTVKIGIANVKTGALQFVDLSNYKPEDLLISRFTWSPDSKSVVFQAQNREQSFLDLTRADKETGKTALMFKETSNDWVEVIDNPKFLKDNSFLWLSARNGFKHLYRFDQNGTLIKQITDGDWEIRDFYGVDERTGFAYFSGTKDDVKAVQIYRVKLDGSNFQRISDGEGSHLAQFNPNFTQFVDLFSSVNAAPQAVSRNHDGTMIRNLSDNQNQSKPVGKTEFLQVKSRDGFTMEAMLIKPANFDASRKYPVMELTYSGPHSQSVVNQWRDDANEDVPFQPLLDKGYLIWICDNRTASGKGAKSERAAYKNFGANELADLEDGVNYLKTLPYVDASRIGLHGWSFGGFMTAYAMTHSKAWKIGIAGGTVSDWRLYDSIYTERYMRTTQNNPNGYQTSSVTAAAANLNGKLLLIHGAIDDNVHLQNTMQLVYALQQADKQFDLMLYPNQQHGVSNPAQHQHLQRLMIDYITKNL